MNSVIKSLDSPASYSNGYCGNLSSDENNVPRQRYLFDIADSTADPNADNAASSSELKSHNPTPVGVPVCQVKKNSTRPIKRYGGKDYLAQWIISLMPARAKNTNKVAPEDPGWLHYVEPYFGGGAVLFAHDPEGISEIINDRDR